MSCAFPPPLRPMLAKLTDALPSGDHWLFEPKWDGFRALVWKDRDGVFIQSRELKPLARYFPEIEQACLSQLPAGCVLDGELVIVTNGRLDFEGMQLRLHPAASRVRLLSQSSPAAYVVWDLLALGSEDLRSQPQKVRRERLVETLAHVTAPLHLTPATRDRRVAEDWFSRFEGAGLDGVIAKPEDLPYVPDKRVLWKVKHQRTAECVVAGFRWYKDSPEKRVGSLLLGLYNSEGQLNPVGVCSSFKREHGEALVEKLGPLRADAAQNHPWRQWAEWQDVAPSEVKNFASRWNPDKALRWEPIRLGLVVEVSYDHMQGHRFRHATHFVRWRPDKSPHECNYAQLDVTPPQEISQIFQP